MLRGLLLLICVVACSGPAHAIEEGISGRIGAGVAVVNRADNLTGNGRERIMSLSEKARSTTKVHPVPVVELAYRHGGNELHFGSFADEMAGVGLGLKHRDEAGVVDITGFYSFLATEWEDPFEIGVNRQETDVDRYGMRVAWESIMGSYWGASYRSVTKEVENDRRGELTPDLRRDGTIHLLKAHWKPQIGKGFFAGPFVSYERGAMDGRSESYDGYAGGFDGTYRTTMLLLVAKISGGWTEYDNIHPIFGKTRREQEYGITTNGTFFNPFDCKNYFVSAGISHRTRIVNIDFFDSNSTVFFGTIGYSF